MEAVILVGIEGFDRLYVVRLTEGNELVVEE
jgi:hypothetical protein